MFLNSFFLQNAALSHQTVLVASQFGVAELIPAAFEVHRCILAALEQFGETRPHFGEKMNSKAFLRKIRDFW